jgi:diguanylate cyclase (GGDEF)-like protein/PAS domain S-box-containing protein
MQMLRNEPTFHLAAEAAKVGFWEYDLATDLVTHCSVTAAILGRDAEPSRCSVHELAEVVPAEDLSSFSEKLHAAIVSGEPFDLEFRIRRSDGEVHWASIRGMSLRDPQGKAIKATGVIFDITDRKLVEQAMHDTQIRYHLAIEAARIGTWEQDVATDITYISPVTAEVLGLPSDKNFLRRDEWQAMIVPEDLPKTATLREQGLKTGQSFNIELRHRRPDGKIIWVAVRGLLQLDQEGRPLRSVGIMQDISEAKQAEDILRANEGRFRLLTEYSPDAILVDLNESVVYANSCAVELFGATTAQELLGQCILDFIEPEFHEAMHAQRPLMLDEKQKPALFELRMRCLNGGAIDVQAICGKVMWEGQPAVQVMLRDITELKQAQERLRISNERLKVMIEGTGEGIWEWDAGRHVFAFSGGIKELLVAQQNESYVTEAEWQNAIHPEDVERVMGTFGDSLLGKTPAYECEYRLKTRQGGWKWVKARGIIVERDAQHRPLLMTGTLSDITARKEADELTWRQANLDVLTSLPNRRLFRERLEVELLRAKRTQHQLALLFIDLDGFKQVNDLYGHDAGDLLLIEAADRLKRCIRATDIVSRLGGDEFTVILTDLVQMDHVEFICQKILLSLTEPFALGEDVGHVSGSIGVALHPLDGQTSEELTRKADQAMYAAKQTGKNQFNYFTREMDDRAHLRLRLTNDLHSALLLNQFEVHYQPVVDLNSGRITKAEALLRWRHPTLGKIEPSLFIPLTEESGLIRTIGNWVFREAAWFSKRCSEHLGMPFQISVNKSPVQFMARETEDNWLDYMLNLGLPAHSICVEITEGALLNVSPRVADRLLEFRDAGIEVALDDFGTGYSSMAYLQKFDIDYLKIDRSFVMNILTDRDSRTIAETIIVMAHKLEKRVVAEGIETPGQLACLMQAGCDYGQGFLFSPAVPTDTFLELLTKPIQLPTAPIQASIAKP